MATNPMDGIVNNMLRAYFRDTRMTALVSVFRKTLRELADNQTYWTQQSRNDHAFQCIQLLMVSLMSLLVEHGELSDLESATSEGIKSSVGKLCEMEYNKNICPLLSTTDDYVRWTHLSLYYITCLKAEKFPYFDSENKRTGLIDFKGIGVSRAFIMNVIVLLFAILMLRLAYVILYIKGADVRHDIEGCLFLSITAFYSTYVYYRKSASLNSESMKVWDELYSHVDNTYLGKAKVFSSLKTPYPVKRYLDQDLAPTVYKCILDSFVRPNEPLMFDQFGNMSTYSGIKCLYNIKLNSLGVLSRYWMRRITSSKYSKFALGLIVLPLHAVYSFYKSAYDSAISAYELVEDIYDDDNPILTRTGQIGAGLLAFTGKLAAWNIVTGVSAIGKGAKAALMYAFSSKELYPETVKVPLSFEQPRRPAYLVWKRAKDGRFESIYTIHPLPRTQIAGELQYGQFSQFGGKAKATPVAAVMAKGHYKQGLTAEEQKYIIEKNKLKTNLKGGSRRQYGGASSDLVMDSDESYDPTLYDYTAIDHAEDVATIVEDGQNYRLILPIPPLQKEAMEKAVYVDVPDPAAPLKPKAVDGGLPPAKTEKEYIPVTGAKVRRRKRKSTK